MRHRVLVWEKPIVGIETNIRMTFHRFSQNEGSQSSRGCGGNRLLEEQPDVSATAGAGSLQYGLNAKCATRFHECPTVLAPALLIEVSHKEEAGFIQKHGVDARDERLAGLIRTGQVPSDYFVRQWQELLILALRTLDSRLLADTSNPFIATGGRVTRFAGFSTFESPWINFVPPTEEGPEEPDFGISRGVLMNEVRFEEHVGSWEYTLLCLTTSVVG